MATLDEEKEALKHLEGFHGGYMAVAITALRREIAREEAEERGKLPTLAELRIEARDASNYADSIGKRERHAQISSILAAVEKLAPELKRYVAAPHTQPLGPWLRGASPLNDFADAIASIVRLDP